MTEVHGNTVLNSPPRDPQFKTVFPENAVLKYRRFLETGAKYGWGGGILTFFSEFKTAFPEHTVLNSKIKVRIWPEKK